jgi:hypothetical protein
MELSEVENNQLTYSSLYDRFELPPNLCRHMVEVAAVGLYVAESINEKVNLDVLLPALLLHDLANIVKFKPPFLGEMEADQDHWLSVQQTMRGRYGTSAHTATITILQEMQVKPEIINLIEEMRSIAEGRNLTVSIEARIGDYADTCVVPDGIVGFEERLTDLKLRYQLDDTDPGVRSWIENAMIVEKYMLDRGTEMVESHDFQNELERCLKMIDEPLPVVSEE